MSDILGVVQTDVLYPGHADHSPWTLEEISCPNARKPFWGDCTGRAIALPQASGLALAEMAVLANCQSFTLNYIYIIFHYIILYF